MLSFFPRDVLNKIWGLIESVSEGFPTFFCTLKVIHMFRNIGCTTCFTLCRWLLFCFLPLLTVWLTVLVSVFPLSTPTPHLQPHIIFSFQIWILCQNSLTRELKIRVVGLVVYKFRKIIGKIDFPYHFKKIIVRYKKIGYNINVMRQTACLVVNPIKVNSFAYLFNCTTVGRTSD